MVRERKPRRQIISGSIGNSTPPSYVMQRLTCGAVRDGKHMQSVSEIPTKNLYSFLNRRLPWRCRPNCLRSLIDHKRLQNMVRILGHSAVFFTFRLRFLSQFDVICDLLLNRSTCRLDDVCILSKSYILITSGI